MDSLRLSDAERDQAIARLGEHYAAGRLDKDEYDERSDAVWSAKTRGQLRPVFADLEAAPWSAPWLAPWSAPSPAAVRRSGPPAGWKRLPTPVLVLLVVLVALTVATHLPIILFGLIAWCLLRFRHPRRHW